MSNLTNGQSYDPVDDVLNDMRDHVSNLQDKLTFAGNAIGQSQGVNEKIAIMKEACYFFLFLLYS
jgi:hypothetical protein